VGEADVPVVSRAKPSLSFSTSHLLLTLQDSVSDLNGQLTISSTSSEHSYNGGALDLPLHLPTIEAASRLMIRSKITKFEMRFLLSSSELIRIDEWIISPPAPAPYQKWAIVGV
ncbi:hypothetical protein Tco_0259780, partial [Tanacetum coccineum]